MTNKPDFDFYTLSYAELAIGEELNPSDEKWRQRFQTTATICPRDLRHKTFDQAIAQRPVERGSGALAGDGENAPGDMVAPA